MDEKIKQHLQIFIDEEKAAIQSDYDELIFSEEFQKETPIEQLFHAALFHILKSSFYGNFIHPQHQIGKFRVDFYAGVTFYSQSQNKDLHAYVVVECDGHDFHERTKEQASNDKRRDRTLQAQGHTVLRFTGSDIWRDPEKCAMEVFRFLVQKIHG